MMCACMYRPLRSIYSFIDLWFNLLSSCTSFPDFTYKRRAVMAPPLLVPTDDTVGVPKDLRFPPGYLCGGEAVRSHTSGEPTQELQAIVVHAPATATHPSRPSLLYSASGRHRSSFQS